MTTLPVDKKFDLDSVISILRSTIKGSDGTVKPRYQEVVLQFVDEYLSDSIDVYIRLQQSLPSSVNLYITADSTWGSSADDISAQHVNGDILVYFGSDLSSSSIIPVIVVPELKTCSTSTGSLVNKLRDEVLTHHFSSSSSGSTTRWLILYEASYYHTALRLSMTLFNGNCVTMGCLPAQADLQYWGTELSKQSTANTTIGGLLVPRSLLKETVDSESSEKDNLAILYIGEKDSQLESITLRLSTVSVYQYHPTNDTVTRHCGQEGTCGRILRERYGGIHKVKDATIIGIILGSMGIDSIRTQRLITRLEKMIVAAGKKYYTFVMGRINEAKLCNFPEVEVYCLIANDDVSSIKPKSFNVPVITPYELEIGLRARDWQSKLSVGLDEMLESDLDTMLARIKVEWEEELSMIDEDEEAEKAKDLLNADEVLQNADLENQQLISLDNIEGNGQVIVFESAAAEYFQQRSFKGLNEQTSTEEYNLQIQMGQIGIAAKYEQLQTRK